MAASKGDKDPIIESQEKVIKALDLEAPDPEATTARNPYPADEAEDEDEPEPETKG